MNSAPRSDSIEVMSSLEKITTLEQESELHPEERKLAIEDAKYYLNIAQTNFGSNIYPDVYLRISAENDLMEAGLSTIAIKITDLQQQLHDWGKKTLAAQHELHIDF